MGKGHSSRCSQRGLTLVETMAAAGLISLIVLFTLGLIPSFKLSNRRANAELHAGAFAQSSLETLRSMDFDKVAGKKFDALTNDGITYTAVVTTDEPASAGIPSQEISKKVRVTVSWRWSERDQTTFRETILCRLPRS